MLGSLPFAIDVPQSASCRWSSSGCWQAGVTTTVIEPGGGTIGLADRRRPPIPIGSIAALSSALTGWRTPRPHGLLKVRKRLLDERGAYWN